VYHYLDFLKTDDYFPLVNLFEKLVGRSVGKSTDTVWGSSIRIEYTVTKPFNIHEKIETFKQCCGTMTWHFGVDPDPRIHASDKWIRIRILLFSSLTFKRPAKN
jgi:hypothetical protein